EVAARRGVRMLELDVKEAVASDCAGVHDQRCRIVALQICVPAAGSCSDHRGSQRGHKADAGDTVLHGTVLSRSGEEGTGDRSHSSESAGCDLQQLDRLEVYDAATNTLGRV